MVKPISSPVPVKNIVKKTCSSIDKAAAKIRLENLIKEFEECAKKQPNNETLARHIQNLKESLKKYK